MKQDSGEAYEQADFEAIRETIKELGEDARALAETIAGGLVAPVQPGFVPMAFFGDRFGRVLVAVLPNRPERPTGGEGDPFEKAMKAFNEALKAYGRIGDIGV